MQRRVTIRQVNSIVKLSLFLIWYWPIPQDATKLKMFCVKLYYSLNIILGICRALPVIYFMRNNLYDSAALIKGILALCGVNHVIFNFIFQIVNYHHIQNITFEMVHFCGLMKPDEEVVIQRYIDKYAVFHGIWIFNFYFSTFTYLAMTILLTHQPLSTFEYPFDVSYQPLKTIIFIKQSIDKLVLAGQQCVDVFMALLLWFASARFELLIEEFAKVTSVYQLIKCIKKHQELLKYAREVTIVARFFALTTISSNTVCAAVVILLFFIDQHATLLYQFLGVGIIGLSQVFMYTWPAEYLMYTSKDVAQAAFNILKNNDLIKIQKYLQIIIMRSQKPVTVSIPFFLSELSLNYFTMFLSTIVSYFTALRALMSA